MLTLKLEDIVSKGNVRVETGDVSTLAASIKQVGLLQAPLVRVLEGSKDKYAIVDGHRRIAAIRELGWDDVNVTMQFGKKLAPADVTSAQYAANTQRKSLTAFEQAQVAWDLKLDGLKQADVAAEMGLKTKDVSELQRVAKNLLADDNLDPVRASRLTADALFDIAGEDDPHPSDIIRLVVDDDRNVWSAANMVEVERDAVEFYETLEPKLLEWKDQGVTVTSDEVKSAWFRVDVEAKDYIDSVVRIKLEDHIVLPCHIVYLSEGGGMRAPSISHHCTKPKSHFAKDAAVKTTDATEKRKQTTARSEESKANREAKQARRDLALAWKPKRTDLRMMAQAAFVKDSFREDQVRLACTLLDLTKERPKGAPYGWHSTRLDKWFDDKGMSDEAVEAFKVKIILGYRYVEKQWPAQEVTHGIEGTKE
jgi:ParB/RepB/Spo0J family partition protein